MTAVGDSQGLRPVRRLRLDVPSRGVDMEGVLTVPSGTAEVPGAVGSAGGAGTGDRAGAVHPAGALDGTAGRPPLVVCCHGFTDSLHGTADVADYLAGLGLVTYRFTFRGGWSGADMTGMSVLTEVADLEAVLDAAREGAASGTGPWASTDPQRVALLGKSQGGAVAMLTAARRPEQVAALVAWYPALCITDDLHRGLGSLDRVGATFPWMGQRLGRRYAEDVWDLDVYAEVGRYAGPVLVVHGTQDSLVPVSYGQRAVACYADARFLPVPGADHGFHGRDLAAALEASADHLRGAGVLSLPCSGRAPA